MHGSRQSNRAAADVQIAARHAGFALRLPYSIRCMAGLYGIEVEPEVRSWLTTLSDREGYAEAQRAYLIGQAIRDRRLALGFSQVELATRAGMTQPALSRLEAGGVIPTIPLLERISAALDADLIVKISPHAA